MDDALGIVPATRKPGPQGDEPFAPQAIRLRARAIFLEQLLEAVRGDWIIPEEEKDKAACAELARKGLAVERNGGFATGPKGIEVRMEEADLDQILGLTPTPEAQPGAQYVFNGPIGAVAAGPGATAHTTVQVQNVDLALHKVISVQDELGDMADVLFPLLREARRLERQGEVSEEKLRAALRDAEEFKDFQAAVKPNTSKTVVAATKAVLEMVPLLKLVPLIRLRGWHLGAYQKWLVDDLHAVSEQWSKAARITDFLKAYEEALPDGTSVPDWLAAARNYAKSLNPLNELEKVPKVLEPPDEELERLVANIERRYRARASH